MEFHKWKTQGLDQTTHEPVGKPTLFGMFKITEGKLFDEEAEKESAKKKYHVSKNCRRIMVENGEEDVLNKWCIETFKEILDSL